MKFVIGLLLFVFLLLSAPVSALDEYKPFIVSTPPTHETIKVHVKVIKDSVLFFPVNYSDTIYTKNSTSYPPWYKNPILYTSLVSLIFALLAYNLTKKNKSYDFLFDFNKKLIDDPKLWAIYDSHLLQLFPVPTKPTEDQRCKFRALGFYLLNNFELVFSNTVFWSNSRIVWASYMCDIFRKSHIMRLLLYKNLNEKSRKKVMLKEDAEEFEKLYPDINNEPYAQLYSKHYIAQLLNIFNYVRMKKKFVNYEYIIKEFFNFLIYKLPWFSLKLLAVAVLVYLILIFFNHFNPAN
ncbi:MAG: hypothetical protein IAE93_14235 [Ignavibacteria bacterium]|nr:hypothetical protein [Ignavibacteria bacterium]